MIPTLTRAGQVVWRWLGRAQTTPDADHGDAYAHLVGAATGPLDHIEQVVRGRDGRVGWQAALDPDTAPAATLAWLAQWPGETLPPTLAEAAQRARIVNPAGWYRGTPDAIRREIREHLIGSRRVELTERYDDSPFVVGVRIYATQVPDQGALEGAIRDSLPAGVRPVLTTLAGQTIGQVAARYDTLADVDAAYLTLQDLLEDIP